MALMLPMMTHSTSLETVREANAAIQERLYRCGGSDIGSRLVGSASIPQAVPVARQQGEVGHTGSMEGHGNEATHNSNRTLR